MFVAYQVSQHKYEDELGSPVCFTDNEKVCSRPID